MPRYNFPRHEFTSEETLVTKWFLYSGDTSFPRWERVTPKSAQFSYRIARNVGVLLITWESWRQEWLAHGVYVAEPRYFDRLSHAFFYALTCFHQHRIKRLMEDKVWFDACQARVQ
jgi:hypothetical protein